MDVALLIEQLAIANIKLYNVCDKKAELAARPSPSTLEMQDLLRQDIELCRLRSELRRKINEALGVQTATDTVKRYGS